MKHACPYGDFTSSSLGELEAHRELARHQEDPADLRSWTLEDLLALARTAGELWDSTGREDPYDVLSARQRALLDRAAASYLTETEGGLDAGEYLRLAAHGSPAAGEPPDTLRELRDPRA
jgi:hypothetical protein